MELQVGPRQDHLGRLATIGLVTVLPAMAHLQAEPSLRGAGVGAALGAEIESESPPAT